MLNAVSPERITKRILRLSLGLCLCTSLMSAQHFTRTDLTADAASTSSQNVPNLDSLLLNPWGIARSSGSAMWVADNHSGFTTLYNPAGANVGTFTVPGLDGNPAAPTGTVFNFANGFQLPNGKNAIFIFVTEDGTISGWNGGPTAVIVRNRSKEAIYKGCALALIGGQPFLYATNFKLGRVEVFNAGFVQQFVSPNFMLPQLPRNFVPFGIQNVGGNLVVTYAHRDPGEDDEDHGPGKGFVAIFSPLGKMLAILKHGDYFDAPWGIALAPGDFGTFSHRLLIGNQGDGKIHAFNPFTGEFEGTLLAEGSNSPLQIDGLWSIGFGNNSAAGSAIELLFTAGPNEENNGIFGKIVPVATEQRGNGE
jgi:uncharacterized protein (TIGR03118 family)